MNFDDPSLCISEASKQDLNEILRLYSHPDLDDGNVLTVPDAESIFEHISHYPNYKVYVAVGNTGVIGTFALLIMDNLVHLGTPSAIIEDVAVDSAMQRSCVGKEMMRYAIQLAAENGCYKATLSSNLTRDKAHVFYDSLNFERLGYSFRMTPDIRGRKPK